VIEVLAVLVVFLVLAGLYALGVRLPDNLLKLLGSVSREATVALVVLAGIAALVALAGKA
jgi:hypothetical protein